MAFSIYCLAEALDKGTSTHFFDQPYDTKQIALCDNKFVAKEVTDYESLKLNFKAAREWANVADFITSDGVIAIKDGDTVTMQTFTRILEVASNV